MRYSTTMSCRSGTPPTKVGAPSAHDKVLLQLENTPPGLQIRLSNGRYVRVSVGDSLDGGQVAAISDSALNYVKRGRTVTLQIPQ